MTSPVGREDQHLSHLVNLAKDAIGDELTAQERQGSAASSRSSPNGRHRSVATSCSARLSPQRRPLPSS